MNVCDGACEVEVGGFFFCGGGLLLISLDLGLYSASASEDGGPGVGEIRWGGRRVRSLRAGDAPLSS